MKRRLKTVTADYSLSNWDPTHCLQTSSGAPEAVGNYSKSSIRKGQKKSGILPESVC